MENFSASPEPPTGMVELLEENVFFISDRQKGSLQSFGEVFSGGLKLEHDINHVENNLLACYKCGDLLRELFQKAVNCYTVAEKAQ